MPTRSLKLRRIKPLILPVVFLLFAVSCARQFPEETLKPTKARQKLIDLCKNDYNLDIVTKAYDNTLWIYLPLDKSFLSITTSKDGPVISPDSEEKPGINFLDGEFADNAFQIRYDIGLKKIYTNNRGITTKFSAEYATKQRFLLSALTRAYSDIEKKPDSNRYAEKIVGDRDFLDKNKDSIRDRFLRSHVKTANVPDFIVLIIADIEKGIEMRTYLYLQDYRRATQDPGFSEEYVKRAIAEQPIGHEVIIGDKAGSYLKTYDLSWAEFLTRQMLHRVNFKYVHSTFPPYSDALEQLTEIAAETVRGYDFNDFESINFINLNTEKTRALSKEQLQSIEITPPALPGKLHHLKFEIKPPTNNNEMSY